MENAESMVRSAIRACPVLAQREIQIFSQGSYRNNTNVKKDSDVDICVRCMDTCMCDFSQAPGASFQTTGMLPASYLYPQFKNEVEAALVEHFGEDGVTRGKKAFDVHPNGYRVDADVVPAIEHRRYFYNWRNQIDYHSGTEFYPDNGGTIVNWPHQHYENGVEKNKATGNRFKFITRAMKRLRFRMEGAGIEAAKGIPSYFIECLVYNAPNHCFGHAAYYNDVREVLAHLFNNVRSDEPCHEWTEVNQMKYLFRWMQPWSRQQGFSFVSAAWNFVGFE
jgi:hypothetical protein